ncbi:hypothetical protein [Mesorhizobium captivum]|uniref:hypothetical protein n=1 Tax=Mesorhizobium captivum TaxID=3072319 RepID=UPI002A247D2E|nr:hypothetical protein [Mesorhizobium sp. VK22E]MDX8508607.1 hypothetical protein [Mesorhizobium sp. VK22E]
MPIIPEIQERLRLAFPPSCDLLLSRAVQEGSFLAGHLFEGESFLNNVIGRDIRGHVRRVGIAYQIDLYCNRGDLPFVTAMKPMPKGNWHWLEITATGAIGHVVRTDDVDGFPDEAESRQDKRLSIQPDLLSWSEKDKDINKLVHKIPKLYAWLTFRAAHDGKLSHLCWGAPAPDTDTWIGHINVLEEVAKRGAEVPAVAKVPDPKEVLRLKDHVAQALEEDAKKKGA